MQQIEHDALKAQAQLEPGKVRTAPQPDQHGDRQQTEIFNPYKQGNDAQGKLF